MLTRSALRLSGSELVESSSSPSHPSAAAVRAIDPTLLGLSTQSRTISLDDRAMRSSLETSGGRLNTPIASSGTPSPVTSRRMSALATRVIPPAWCTASENSDAHFGSHSTTSGIQPASSARCTTKSPSAMNSPSFSADFRCAMVVSCRSRQRKAFSRVSSASSSVTIMKN